MFEHSSPVVTTLTDTIAAGSAGGHASGTSAALAVPNPNVAPPTTTESDTAWSTTSRSVVARFPTWTAYLADWEGSATDLTVPPDTADRPRKKASPSTAMDAGAHCDWR